MIMKLCDDLVKFRIRAQSCKELALQIITLTIVAWDRVNRAFW